MTDSPYIKSGHTPEEIAIFKKMSPGDKYRLIASMHMQARQWKRAAFQTQHPDWTDEQLNKAVKEVFLYGSN